MSPLLAQSGHDNGARRCPLLGVKQTLRFNDVMSALGQKRTLNDQASRDQNIPVRSFSNEELRMLEFGRTQWKSVFRGGLLLSLAAAKGLVLRGRRGSRPRAPVSP